MSDEPKCPFPHEQIKAATTNGTKSIKQWWPKQVNLDVLSHNDSSVNPISKDFDYAKAFSSLNLFEVKDFIRGIMVNDRERFLGKPKNGQPAPDGLPYGQEHWWPADWGHYGPLFIRLAWHSAGTYRVQDGRGGGGRGLHRFAPLNSWPDNANLDKARRILWPVKERFGSALSWADLFILAGNVALEDMGLETVGFAGGREDVYLPDSTYWGPESEWLANERYDEKSKAESLDNPLAAVQMGLIYVNPEGPNGNAEDFVGSARDIRETFARMAMNDEETVALVAGGHAFGKAHGNGDASKLGPEPEGTTIESTGLGWENPEGKGHSEDTVTSGLEGAWTPTPLKWDNKYLELMFKYEWQKVESPAGAQQWEPIDCQPEDMVPDAHVPGKMNKPMMLTTDLALRFGDENYRVICEKFLADFDYFSDAFAKAWFKLTHRDMGPVSRYHGQEVPKESFLWQDPIHPNTYPDLTEKDLYNLKQNILHLLDKGEIGLRFTWGIGGAEESRPLDLRDLVFTAWVSASTYRNTDRRGGANGARILLEPMKSWEFVDYERVEATLGLLRKAKESLNIQMSDADLIVFGGKVGLEKAIQYTGYKVDVPFVTGRGDATQDQVDVESVNYLEPFADGFLNWTHPVHNGVARKLDKVAEHLMVERSALLGLTIPEMVAMLVGFRALSLHHRGSDISSQSWNRKTGHKVNKDFLENALLKQWYKWSGDSVDEYGNSVAATDENPAWVFAGQHLASSTRIKASRADMFISSNSILRSVAEVYCGVDGDEILIRNFIQAWNKVMMADRFDVKG
jgi:catalase-peroxidase